MENVLAKLGGKLEAANRNYECFTLYATHRFFAVEVDALGVDGADVVQESVNRVAFLQLHSERFKQLSEILQKPPTKLVFQLIVRSSAHFSQEILVAAQEVVVRVRGAVVSVAGAAKSRASFLLKASLPNQIGVRRHVRLRVFVVRALECGQTFLCVCVYERGKK